MENCPEIRMISNEFGRSAKQRYDTHHLQKRKDRTSKYELVLTRKKEGNPGAHHDTFCRSAEQCCQRSRLALVAVRYVSAAACAADTFVFKRPIRCANTFVDAFSHSFALAIRLKLFGVTKFGLFKSAKGKLIASTVQHNATEL